MTLGKNNNCWKITKLFALLFYYNQGFNFVGIENLNYFVAEKNR